MEPSTPAISVQDGHADADRRVDGIESEVPMPLKPLSLAEERVWNYVAVALKDYGLIHRTDAMLMHLIVSTFVQWVDAETALEKHVAENNGSFMSKTPNGYEQPHQCYYMARNLKTELLRMLPEACLTIPSFAKVKQSMREPQQGDMFDPLVAFVSNKPQAPPAPKLVHSR
ncbi:P27 family phage terminase small subunit [Paraburkholderia sp. Cy-641]|uniref:P27 family phage terminase small subunit n=1 Tax=Paraburkholderia sp. Cy-641 TaxID=2608337 RepID=UPI00141E1BBD|nr:P27 family phage terminase small subunit [Paraburkholderia sp. Cy-641]NIF80148.1 P27 family phage terminase small subunit [Paraburkholderia sp. Cy-641]